ncbi:AcrR family transcriptional regulator [Nocardioides luteus]|uniref:TetR family transcriptional regulator n=1 Tax=Nocardioides luteus TaxID=1844 RepID=A0ABQ5SRT1_9ACTN|nr:TetR/AcrR family transcriptional regulator [Nocardioides luteus]MDR7311078.1 AcrR family transcriptional regulator [Nocardioides luteus]GGR68085.1 TetR family transcriptional regulator [Nocardioides luteus]GLJ66624.1 TetR family transcriptional regulator [Nocardioides luteus]
MTKSWPSRRTAPAVRKGDLREQQILDSAEELLATTGYADVTVGDIAEAAGITRGALYFYFGSKQEVLAALVARTAQVLREKSAGAARDESRSVEESISVALEVTAQLWREHGLVMRMAVDLASTVPAIDQVWAEAAEVSIEAIADVLQRGGVPAGTAPTDAQALARALCWMIERSFYQASKISTGALDEARQTCTAIWLQAATPR